jgi:BTB/POZ domain
LGDEIKESWLISISDIMEVDLRRFGIIGNNLTPEPRVEASRTPSADRMVLQASKGLGADLAKLFNQPPESGSGTDFTITALRDGDWDDEELMSSSMMRAEDQNQQTWLDPNATTSPPIHVHKLILQARWPHFARLYNAQMAEFHTKKMHIPEPYSVVKAFLYYLYTDSIQPEECGELSDVAGLLVMSNIYNIPHLRLLCVNRLSKELDVDHACIIWHCAGIANEDWLRKRAANFCLMHWGRVVRTQGFLKLPRQALVELSQEIDMEGRVVGGELDLEPEPFHIYIC